jgi:glycerophosphoryl diester phosphodiesterase
VDVHFKPCMFAKKTLRVSATIVFAFAVLPMSASEPALPALKLIANKRPLVIGHRGYCQFAPENTLPSFKLAMAAGADMVELDYYHSKDHQMVVMHDPDLDRTTNATNLWKTSHVKLESKTVAEIETLDAGKWFDPKYAGTKVPLLTEALDTIQNGCVTLIERKQGPAADCIKLLHDRDLINKVVVQAFDWRYLRDFHEKEPQQILGALGPPKELANGATPTGIPKELSARWLDELEKAGAKVAVWSQAVSKEAVQLAHQRGIKVWIYTINDSDLANRLLDMGVDGIITNNTSLIWRALALRNAVQ